MNREVISKILTVYKNKLHNLPNDHSRDTMCKLSKYNNVIDLASDILKINENIQELELISQTDPDIAAMAKNDIANEQSKIEQLNEKLENILIIPDSITTQNIIMEIRAGTGGDEASIFVNDLSRMYSKFAEIKGWSIKERNKSENHIGIKSTELLIKGKDVYSHLSNESGVHRVQRIPATESQGRIHTSTVSVSILPAEENLVDIVIKTKDLVIDTYRASGAGGQHVNKTDSAVRITHIPSGIVVQCQQERSQHSNKENCMRELKHKLHILEKEKIENQTSQKRKQQIGTAQRNEKIRTYNYPQNRITDHRYNITFYKLDIMMEGNICELIEQVNQGKKQEDLKHILEDLEEN